MFCPLVNGRLWFSTPHAFLEELVHCVDDLDMLRRSSPRDWQRTSDAFDAELELATFGAL